MRRFPRGGRRTLAGRVLAEVLSLVATEEAAGLDLGGGASGELLVEADDALHAKGIGGGADGLRLSSASVPGISASFVRCAAHSRNLPFSVILPSLSRSIISHIIVSSSDIEVPLSPVAG